MLVIVGSVNLEYRPGRIKNSYGIVIIWHCGPGKRGFFRVLGLVLLEGRVIPWENIILL